LGLGIGGGGKGGEGGEGGEGDEGALADAPTAVAWDHATLSSRFKGRGALRGADAGGMAGGAG
jgi:hypothetical protein